MDRARRQIQQYELDIQNYQQRQSKAERVLQRLQSEYETQIAVKIKNKNSFLYCFFLFLSNWFHNSVDKRQILNLIDMRYS